jgi:hypothetical protein
VNAVGLAAAEGGHGEEERKESHPWRAIIEVVAMQPRGGDGLKGSLANKAQKKAQKGQGQEEFPQGEALDQALTELEKKIERVRTLYEQYFMGIEKVEPGVPRKDVTRIMLLYAQQHIRNTGQRFRFHSMQQKWNIYITLWNRTMREIEAGTYKRDVARVTRKLAREGKALTDDAAIELGLKKKLQVEPTPVPKTAPKGPPSAPAQPSAAATAKAAAGGGRQPTPTPPGQPRRNTPTPPGVTDEQMQALYRRYVQAKKLVSDPNADNIKYESLVATVAKQTPQIMQKYGVDKVEFTVVIREDKVVLKAIPKKA